MGDQDNKLPTRRRRTSDLSILDNAVRTLYPAKSPQEIRQIRSRVVEYVASGLSDGFEIGLVKGEGHQARIKILRLVEQPRQPRTTRFLSNGDDNSEKK